MDGPQAGCDPRVQWVDWERGLRRKQLCYLRPPEFLLPWRKVGWQQGLRPGASPLPVQKTP
jgi:hypothetical protein